MRSCRPLRFFRVGDAVPNSGTTAGYEERATFFVSLVKNGLAAQNTWTAAAALEEEMYTRKEWDKHEILGSSRSWNTGGLCFGIRAVKAKSCRVEENTDHSAVFLDRDMSKEEKQHTNKTNIKNWKPSPLW